MKLSDEYSLLVKSIKNKVKERGERITNEEIAKRLGLTRTYFSSLLNETTPIKAKHIEDLKAHFQMDLSSIDKPAPAGDKLNRERAIIKVLIHEVARLKAKDEGITFDEALSKLKQSTSLVLDDLDF
jgi:transcriptional regulator with XRE-family HTH domain